MYAMVLPLGDPFVRWQRVSPPDLPRSARVEGTSLILQSVERTDGGLYRCIATNSLGTAYAQISLIVEGEYTCTLE